MTSAAVAANNANPSAMAVFLPRWRRKIEGRYGSTGAPRAIGGLGHIGARNSRLSDTVPRLALRALTRYTGAGTPQRRAPLMSETLKLLMEKDGPIGWIVFNQPEKRNAVSQEMWELMPKYVNDLATADATWATRSSTGRSPPAARTRSRTCKSRCWP